MFKKLLSTKKYLFGLIFLLIICTAAGFYYYKMSLAANTQSEPSYEESAVSRGDITVSLTADGSADISVTNLSFNVSGKIAEILVEPGQAVKAGDVVARLDDTDYANALTKAQQNRDMESITNEQQIRELKVQLNALESEYNVMLQVPDAYTQKEIDDKKIEYEQALYSYDTQLSTNSISLSSQETSVKSAQDALNNTVLTSPINSTVLAVEYSVGETIEENTTCIILQNDSNIAVVTSISEVDINSVSVGQTVEAIFDAYEDEVYTGTVAFIDSIAETDSSGLVTYEVEITLDEGKDKIKQGMTCTLELIQKQVKDVLMIPIKAVSIVDGEQVVQVKNDDGTITKQVVTTGFSDDTYTEVSKGLEEGQTVLVPVTKTITQDTDSNSGMMPGPGM